MAQGMSIASFTCGSFRLKTKFFLLTKIIDQITYLRKSKKSDIFVSHIIQHRVNDLLFSLNFYFLWKEKLNTLLRDYYLK